MGETFSLFKTKKSSKSKDSSGSGSGSSNSDIAALRTKIRCTQKSKHVVKCNFQLNQDEYGKLQRSAKVATDESVPMVYVGIGVAVIVILLLIGVFGFLFFRSSQHSDRGTSSKSFHRSSIKSGSKGGKSKCGSKRLSAIRSKKSNSKKSNIKSKKSAINSKKSKSQRSKK